MRNETSTPGRPLGVTIAIIASVLVYSVLPLLWIGVTMLIEQRLNAIGETSIPVNGEEIAPAVSGGNIDFGIDTPELLLQTALSIGFLVIALLAWRGRSKIMRYIFLSAVVGLSMLMIALQFLPLLDSETEAGISGGSLETLFATLTNGHVLSMILLPIYVVWYLNRGPARAFYRGYYLAEPSNEHQKVKNADSI